jgi:hypothetical protein
MKPAGSKRDLESILLAYTRRLALHSLETNSDFEIELGITFVQSVSSEEISNTEISLSPINDWVKPDCASFEVQASRGQRKTPSAQAIARLRKKRSA